MTGYREQVWEEQVGFVVKTALPLMFSKAAPSLNTLSHLQTMVLWREECCSILAQVLASVGFTKGLWGQGKVADEHDTVLSELVEGDRKKLTCPISIYMVVGRG